MIPIHINSATLTPMADLVAGCFFVRARSAGAPLSVMLEGNSGHLLWLELAGTGAFRIRFTSRPLNAKAVAFAIDPSTIQVRVDPASVADPNADHLIGQLLVDAEGAGIWCGWSDESEHFSRIVRLASWAPGSVGDVPVKFDRWSLGSAMADGSWIELAKSPVP